MFRRGARARGDRCLARRDAARARRRSPAPPPPPTTTTRCDRRAGRPHARTPPPRVGPAGRRAPSRRSWRRRFAPPVRRPCCTWMRCTTGFAPGTIAATATCSVPTAPAITSPVLSTAPSKPPPWKRMRAPDTGWPCASSGCACNRSVSPATTRSAAGVMTTRATGDGACCWGCWRANASARESSMTSSDQGGGEVEARCGGGRCQIQAATGARRLENGDWRTATAGREQEREYGDRKGTVSAACGETTARHWLCSPHSLLSPRSDHRTPSSSPAPL